MNFNPAAPRDHMLLSFGAILCYAFSVTYVDNYVRVLAEEGSLWQFHAMRSALSLVIMWALALLFSKSLRPKNIRAVALRSLLHGGAIMIYFGALAFLPVAQVAAGLFTAPIFVLLIQRWAFNAKIAPLQILAVAVGFCGVVMVLGPEVMQGTSLAALLPILAAVLYAMGNITTRRNCGPETAWAMLTGFFIAIGMMGLTVMLILTAIGSEVAPGPQGFIVRGAVWPDATFLFWIFMQAFFSIFGVGMMIQAYRLAEASRVSVFEYVLLPVSAFWGYILWGQLLSWVAIMGMILIAISGLLISLFRPIQA